ncbi:ABC transporter ATP-binding protein [Blastochloris sulfoviridis]|uniref:ABC transporter ATP-binding protein n=1 Tax=Blastochloris sulfoviridis TaxID=50712 RepID=A0A5M6I111_9HYPH|nr:ABC transporter ATP-binding protein [Blastochloris sulfoviridis]KAA5601856.1 ABC transporter ATP-binding protein [Blastochloris sulfoviridis]
MHATSTTPPQPANPKLDAGPKPDAGKPKLDAGSWPLIKRLITDQGRQHMRGYLVALALMGVVAAMTALAAWLMRDVINRIFVEANYAAIWWLSGAVIVIFVVKGFASWGHAVVLAHIGNRIIAETQTRAFDRLLSQGVGFFADLTSGELVGRIQKGATSTRDVLNLLATSIGRDTLTLVALIVVMVVQDPAMSLIALVLMPVAAFVVKGFVKRVKKVVPREIAGTVGVVSALQETVQGIRVVKSFRLEPLMRQRMVHHVHEVEEAANRIANVASRPVPLSDTLGGVAVALVIMYAGHSVIKGGQTPGEFFSFITALLLAYEPARRLAKLNVDLSAALVGTKLLFDIIDVPPGESDPPGRPALEVKGGRIEFDDVTFGYRPDEPVLRGLSFVAEPGRTTALVGPSGSGKTTIVNLVQRFWPVDGGRIVIDGQDIASVSLGSLRDACAFVSQDTFLFAGTVGDNIAFGREGASQADIEAAARAAHAHDFIMGFPRGYQTQVGELGTQLSGGQRQRIAIARAILKSAPIILLDEATAALDSESEREVQRALEELMRGRTTIVIAHRLQTIVAADKICVVEAGRVVEHGRHDKLLAAKGKYAHLYAIQFRET